MAIRVHSETHRTGTVGNLQQRRKLFNLFKWKIIFNSSQSKKRNTLTLFGAEGVRSGLHFLDIDGWIWLFRLSWFFFTFPKYQFWTFFVLKIFHFDPSFTDFLEDYFCRNTFGAGGIQIWPPPQIVSFHPKVDSKSPTNA